MVESIIEHDEGASHDEQDLRNFKSLEKEIENLKELSQEACIFKVHEALRTTKPEAYTPLLISIGPYHHGGSKFSKMEKLKLMYLKSLLKRGGGVIAMEQCWNKLKGLKERAKSYYVDDIKLSDNDFVTMLLLDGCFIVEFVVRGYHQHDTLFMPGVMKYQVLLDLLLLENQLPFFVLQEVYDTIYDAREPFLDKVKSTFVRKLKDLSLISIDNIKGSAQEIKHLLQVVHILCNPKNIGTQEDETLTTKPKVNSSMAECQPSNTKQERDYWTIFFPPCFFSKQYQDSNIESLLTASELQEAGVHIKKVDKAPSLFHIKFNNGKLEIPSLQISDLTEILFRNIIAYEQHSCDLQGNKYFTDYAQFMDYLINTEKDVVLFRRKGVFINLLGDDKEVTDLFNKLCKGVINSSCDFYFTDVCKKLDRHCKRPWNVLKAKLRHDYFHSPWAGVSTIAAILLLLLTIAQTVIALLDLRNKK